MLPPIETQKCPVESKETLSKTYFAGSYLTVTRDNLKLNSSEQQKHATEKKLKCEQLGLPKSWAFISLTHLTWAFSCHTFFENATASSIKLNVSSLLD